MTSSSDLIRATAALTFLILLRHSTLLSAADGEPTPTAYDLLQLYNFPPGLLPKGVTHCDIDKSTGKFHAYLDGACSFSLEGSYKLKYKSTISGTIEKNRIRDLRGISVQVLFLWLDVAEVVRDGDELGFSIGIASTNFGIENFEMCPQCGCGFNCNVNGDRLRMVRGARPFVSSV